MQLAVDNVDILYYSPLTHCKIFSDKISFGVKVPLKTVHAVWNVQRYQAMPFAWNGHICRLFPDTERLIGSEDNFIPLTGTALQHCLDNFFCQVPRIDASFTTHSRCIRAIQSKRTVKDLLTECTFHCDRDSTPEVMQLSLNTFVVATPTPSVLTLKCGRRESTHNSQGWGAHKFIVPGNCSVLVNGSIAVQERLTMPHQLETEKGAEVMMPALWTTNLQIEIASIDNRRRNHIC